MTARRAPAAPLLLLLSVIASALLAGCTSEPGGLDPSAQNVVVMKSVAFEPEALTVRAGEEVVWVNDSGIPHTVTSNGEGGPLDSDLVRGAQRFAFTFTEPGEYSYRCQPHSSQAADATWTGMVGLVVVEAATAAA